MTRELIAIAIGGSVGASLRWLTVSWIGKITPNIFPWGTLTVNVLGSFCIGFLCIYLFERIQVSTELRLALMVGLLGSFTTFSTFALDAVRMIEDSRFSLLAFYLVSQVFLSIVSVILGMYFATK